MMERWKQRAKKLKTDVPAVFLAIKDGRTPWYAKGIAAAIVIYALSPVDLIPDFIPVLGYLDDVILLPALIAWCVRCIPEDVLADCRARVAKTCGEAKSGKWYYAIPFILIWLAVLSGLMIAFL